MAYKKITAIIRPEALEKVEQALQDLGVPRITITHAKGYGDYADLYVRDWTVEHARIEIFTTEERATEIIRSIVDCAHTGLAGDGIVAVLPVDKIIRIRTRAEAGPDEV